MKGRGGNGNASLTQRVSPCLKYLGSVGMREDRGVWETEEQKVHRTDRRGKNDKNAIEEIRGEQDRDGGRQGKRGGGKKRGRERERTRKKTERERERWER